MIGDGPDDFWRQSISAFLIGSGEENRVYSPVNVYMALASTIYYQAKWTNKFFDRKNEDGVFHSPAGDVQCEFMYEYMDMGGTYYWGERFGAVEKRLDNGHSMWFILPDEGVSVDELLQEAEVMDFFTSDKWENQKAMNIHFYLPKFDVSSKMDLREGLKTLRVTDVFDGALADFSAVTDLKGVCLSKVNHAARVTMDEEGVTAAAYTVMEAAGGSTVTER